MRKVMWGPFQKERSPKRWIVTAVAVLLLSLHTGGLFVFSSPGPLSASAQSAPGNWRTSNTHPGGPPGSEGQADQNHSAKPNRKRVGFAERKPQKDQPLSQQR